MSSVAKFCEWLAGTPLSLMVQSLEWIIPTVQTVHILAIAVVMSSVVLVDLRLLGVAGRQQPISALTGRFFPWVWTALVVLFASGVVLIIGEPARELLNNVFIAKMALLLAAIALTVGFQLSVGRNQAAWDASATRSSGATLLALVSLALWVAIVFCGRWIAYVEHG